MSCSHPSCQSPNRWRPVLELRSRKSCPVTRARFSTLTYCDGHKKVSALSDLLSSEGFDRIVKFLRENGKPAPVRRHTTLTWELLTEEELSTLAETPRPETSLADEALPF